MKPLIVVLSLVCVALAAQLFMRGSGGRGSSETIAATTLMNSFSNEASAIRIKADEEARLAAYLQSNLTARVAELTAASNHLSQTEAALLAVQTELKSKQEESNKSVGRITELESQKDELQSKLGELAGSIQLLNTQIVEAKRKLAAAEGDRDSLSKELVKLQADKAELLRQFNDLAALRAQVALLRDEAAVNQRLSWKAQGVYQASGRKGAEALVSKPPAPALAGDPSLNVDLHEKGNPVEAPAKAVPAK